LTFEHVEAAAHRLAGFGALVEVLEPAAVRDRIVETARRTIARYDSGPPASRRPSTISTVRSV
jgi:hypothetical protein